MPTTAITSAVSGNPKTVFNADQRKLLDLLIPEFEAFVEANNPSHEQRCKAVTDWKKLKATELMKEAPFQAVVNPPEDSTAPQVTAEYADWKSAIRRYFTNYYNNKYLRQIHRQSTSRVSAAATAATTEEGSNQASGPATPLNSKKSMQDFLRRAFVVFSSELSARELFAKENKDLVKSKMQDIGDEYPDLVGGPLRQKALKLLWKDEDHEKWEARLEELQNDIHGNQEEFEFLMFAALEDLCVRKRLGSIMMSFSYAFRDAEDGLKNNTIYMGYNAEADEIISTTPSASDQEAMSNAWCLFADSQIPRAKRYVPIYAIPFNGDGLPIMPHVDVAKASPEQISILLHDFLLAVWNNSPHSKTAPSLPWEKISASPELYIDHTAFKLPVPLANPKDLAHNPMALYALYGYFLTISATTPFQFLSAIENTSITPSGATVSTNPSPAHHLNESGPGQTPSQAQHGAVSSSITPVLPTSAPLDHGSSAGAVGSGVGPESQGPEFPDVPEQPLQQDSFHTSANVDVPPQPVKPAPKHGRGRPKGVQPPTRVSSRAKGSASENPPAVSAPGPSNLKRQASASDNLGKAGSKKKARTWYEYRDANNNLINKQGERIDENGNLLSAGLD